MVRLTAKLGGQVTLRRKPRARDDAAVDDQQANASGQRRIRGALARVPAAQQLEEMGLAHTPRPHSDHYIEMVS